MDEARQTEGDVALWACDQRDPDSLMPGLFHDAENVRCTEGRPETRRGVTKPGWANRVNADQVLSHGTPYGAGSFQDPDGREWLFVAADGYAWRSRPYNARISIPLPTGVRLLSRCTFIQAFNEIFCFRGRHLAPLRMQDIETGFIDLLPLWSAAATYTPATEIAYGPFQSVSSISRVGTLATVVTAAEHGYVNGADVTISGAVETAYNGRFNITVLDELSFTYTVFGAPSTPATGTIKVSNMSRYWSALGSRIALSDFAPVTLGAGALTSAATTATVIYTGHGFITGDVITIAGAAQTEYNGTYIITRIDNNTFTYTFAGSGTTPATGTITMTKRALTRNGTTALAAKTAHGFSTGQSVTIAGADQVEYNDTFLITVTDADHFTFTIAGSPATPATPATGITARTSIVLAAQSPDTNPEAWSRLYNILPNADNALYMNNRLLVPTAFEPASADNYATFNGGSYKKVDYLVATSYLDPIHFDFRDEFRINQGSDDEIIDLARVPNEETVIVWKGHSWGALLNVRLDLSDLAFDLRSRTYGLSARGAWAESGKDIQFLSNRRGIVSITQSEQGKLLGSDVPLSAPIQRTIDRINWPLVSGARMANWNNRLYLGAPLDAGTIATTHNIIPDGALYSGGFLKAYTVTSLLAIGQTYTYYSGRNEEAFQIGGQTITDGETFEYQSGNAMIFGTGFNPWDGLVTAELRVGAVLSGVNNAILVFDFTAAAKLGDPTQGWTPLDTGRAMNVFEWVKLQLDGQERLFYLDSEGYVSLMEESESGDQIADRAEDTGLRYVPIVTRLRTRAYGVSLRGHQRPGEIAVALATLQPSYTLKVKFAGVQQETVVVQDKTRSPTAYFRPFGAAPWDDTNINDDHATPYREDYGVLLSADGFYFDPTGVDLGRFQETLHTVRPSGRQGRTYQIELSNTLGRLKFLGLRATTIPARARRGIQ